MNFLLPRIVLAELRSEDPLPCLHLRDLGEASFMADIEETKLDSVDDHVEQVVPSDHSMPSPEQQEAVIKKKYGGLIPKKPPLISKDHERAYFDSADWALGKKQGEQPGQKPKSLIEVLRPKLQPTPHQPLPARRASYENSENEDGIGGEHIDGAAAVDGALITNEATS